MCIRRLVTPSEKPLGAELAPPNTGYNQPKMLQALLFRLAAAAMAAGLLGGVTANTGHPRSVVLDSLKNNRGRTIATWAQPYVSGENPSAEQNLWFLIRQQPLASRP